LPPTQPPAPLGRRCCWRIELHGLGSTAAPLGYDIYADAILGRADDSPSDNLINLEPYHGLLRGVSRRHAMLRPTQSTLFLLDLDSSNGTYCNALRLATSAVRALSDGDTISLGDLAFQVKIIDSPHHTKS